jgi:hypothetical protein
LGPIEWGGFQSQTGHSGEEKNSMTLASVAEITNFSTKYREKLIIHPNEFIPALLEEEEPRRLKCFQPAELITRFSQAPYHMYRTFEVRIFNGILLHKSCNINVGYKVKCTYSL